MIDKSGKSNRTSKSEAKYRAQTGHAAHDPVEGSNISRWEYLVQKGRSQCVDGRAAQPE